MNAAKNNVCDAPRHDDVEAPAASKSPARASSSDDAYGGMLGYAPRRVAKVYGRERFRGGAAVSRRARALRGVRATSSESEPKRVELF